MILVMVITVDWGGRWGVGEGGLEVVRFQKGGGRRDEEGGGGV